MARTQSTWESYAGSYVAVPWAEGRDILVRGTNKYINFGSIVGETGYGIRDNAGTLQFKNSAGSWTNFGSGGSGGQVDSVVAGTNIAVDNTDPVNPVVSVVLGADKNFVTDAEKAAFHSHSNKAVLDSTTASFTTAQETKLGHISVTQAVDLDAIETRVNALDAAVILIGSWDASSGIFPGGGTAQAGYSYIVSVGGTVDGQVFTANDRIVAIVDNASTTTYAANWHKLDYTDAVLSIDSATGAVSLSTILSAKSAKTTPVDADTMPLNDSADSANLKKVTWANIKATLYAAAALTGLTSYVRATGGVSALSNLGATETIDWSAATNFTGTLDSNITIDFSNAVSGQTITLYLVYSGAQRTIAWTPTIEWGGGTAPVGPDESGEYLVVTLKYVGTTYFGSFELFK